MDLGLSRSELASVGPVPGLNTLKVLPFSKTSRRQRVVVGDGFGQLICLQSKRGESSTLFETQTNNDGNAVTAVALDESELGERIFIAEGSTVHGYSKKGREFSSSRTNLTETIQTLSVNDKHVRVSGKLAFASYVDGNEQEYITFNDPITSLATSSDKTTTLLGLQDNCIRTIQGGSTLGEMPVGGAVTALELFGQSPDAQDTFVYGTETGGLGLTCFDGKSQTFEPLWSTMKSSVPESKINCLTAYDLTKDDVPNIVVGRDNGSVQVYKVMDEGSGIVAEEKRRPGKDTALQFEHTLDESIRAVQGGVVSSPGYDEVVVCTYSGNLLSFTTEELFQPEEGDSLGRSKASVDVAGKSHAMAEELKRLQSKVLQSHTKLAKETGSKEISAGIGFKQFNISHTLSSGSEKDALTTLTFELPMSIDMVLLQSSFPISHEEDTETVGEKRSDSHQSVVISSTTPSVQDGRLQAVFRCTESMKRLEVRLRTIEGQYGEIKATVVAQVKPKLARQITIDIKPLSMHKRVKECADLEKRPLFSSLTISGKFTLNQVHDWISACIPEVPESVVQAKSEEDELELHFENVLIKSSLIVSYRQGCARFESDSISTIAIIREALSSEANKRKVEIAIKFDIHPETVTVFLNKVDKQLSKQAKRANDLSLFQALQEIARETSDTSFLSAEHQMILKQGKCAGSSSKVLEALYGIVCDLYVDVKKFQGKGARHPGVQAELMDILKNYNKEALENFFATR